MLNSASMSVREGMLGWEAVGIMAIWKSGGPGEDFLNVGVGL